MTPSLPTSPTRTVLLVGTFDTKGREYAFVSDELRKLGTDVLLMDVGVLGSPTVDPDFGAASVADAAGTTLEMLRRSGADEGSDSRRTALDAMRRGASVLAHRLLTAGRIHGILGLGGSGGSMIISGVMREMPFGFPKLLVSTMAAGNVSAYVGTSDLCLMHSVADIAGINKISRPVLVNAAAAMAGMTQAAARLADNEDRPAVGITMLGVTTPGASRVAERLRENGYDPIVFHAVGSGGAALESLLDAGELVGIVDFTPKEITDDVLGGIFLAGPHRLMTAGAKGLPQVIVPGAIEVINYGPYETVPLERRDRPTVRHNPEVTAVRATPSELNKVADELASRINTATGPVAVLLPDKGFDSYAEHHGPFADPSADRQFCERLTQQMRHDIPCRHVPLSANDPDFADQVAELFLALAGRPTSDVHPDDSPTKEREPT